MTEKEDFFRLLVENIVDLVTVLDERGIITYASPTSYRVLGYHQDELVGRSILDFIHPGDVDRGAGALELALGSHGEPVRAVHRVRHKDGSWRVFEAVATNLLHHPVVRGLVVNCRDITEREEMERTLREKTLQLDALFDSLPGMAYRCANDPQWTMELVSEGCRELTGYLPGDLVGNAVVSYAELIHPDDRERVWKEVQESLSRGEPFRLVYRIRTAEGIEKWVWEQGRGIFTEDGELLALGGFITDVSERVRAERLLRVQRDLAMLCSGSFNLEEFLGAAVAGTVQATGMEACLVHLADRESGGLRLATYTGLSGDLAMFLEYLKPEEPLVGLLRRGERVCLDTTSGSSTDNTLRAFRDAGFLTVIAVPLMAEGGIQGCLWVLSRTAGKTPATKSQVEVLASQVEQAVSRHRLYEALRDSETRYRLLHDHAGEAIISFDRGLRLVSANLLACEILGFGEGELAGKSLLELGVLRPAELKMILDRVGSLMAGREHFREEVELVRRDGSGMTAEVSGAAVRDGEGDLVGVTLILRDITARKSMERTLRESEERYRATFESTGTAMFLVERDATISDVNPETEKVFGYRREEMVGKMRYMRLLMPEEVEKVKDYSRKLLEGEIAGPVQYEIVARRKDGTPLPALITVSMIPGVDKSVISLIDISEKRAYERQLEERAEQLRDFLDIAAHELRHPATLLKGYAMTLDRYGSKLDEEVTAGALRAIQEGADRLVTVVEELLDVSRIERGRLSLHKSREEVVSLAERAVAEMRAREPGRRIDLEVRGEPGSLHVDPERIARLLIILLDNAVKYSPRERPVEVVLESGESGVVFSVLDRGTGIPEEDRERVFERFYQVEDVLHHAGPGLGLGLYIARSIVELHDGRIWCEPRPGGGTVFRFFIPR